MQQGILALESTKPISRIEATTGERELKSKKSCLSPTRSSARQRSIAPVPFSLLMAIDHYKHYFPVNVRQLLGYAAFSVARPNPKGMRRLKGVLEQHIKSLSMEVTSICNANCQFCGYKHQKRPKEIMSNALFRYSIGQYVDVGGGRLDLTPIVGDPLVDKGLVDKIRFAKQKEMTYVSLFTNLIGLGSFNLRDFLSSGIDEINISTCFGGRKMYARIFGVDRYDAVMHHLDSLLQENRRLGNRVRIIIHLKGDKPYRQMTSSPEYRRICKLYGRNICHIDDQYDNWTGLVEEDDLPKHHTFRKVQNISEPCSELYNGMIIFANGDVGVCWRRDLDAKLVLGNIHESSLKEMWRGERLHTIREKWVKGIPPVVCRRCYCYSPLSRYLAMGRFSILSMETQQE